MFAYIPARGGSKRIPRKNIRPLGGKPLLLHVLDSLSLVPGLSGIGVSSEDPEILRLAESRPGVRTLGPRDPALADDLTGMLDLLQRDAPRFAAVFRDDRVLMVTATAALVTPELYAQALERFERDPDGLVLAVARYEKSPFLALSGEPGRGLSPLFPEMYMRPTKDLPEAFIDAGCFYACRLERVKGLKRLLDLAPLLGIVLPSDVGIDVDTEGDWRKLERAYSRRAAQAQNIG